LSDNINEYPSKLAEEVVSDSYVELAKYTARTRSFPGLYDGMKSVYRRVLYQARDYKKFTKSATLVGETLKLHPHGDSSIYSVLVEMTCAYNNFPLFTGKGNFGGLGFSAASSRYTDAKISDIARLMYLDLVDYADFTESETGYTEPKYLPALIPYCFLAGSRGMSVGLPTTNIPPLNLMDLINYYIDLLSGNDTEYPKPDFGEVIIDCSKEEHSDEMLRTGYGRLWFMPVIIQEDYNKFVVTQETPNGTFNRVLNRLQTYIDEDVVDHIDETDQNGYRHVFITNNTNKLSPDDLKEIISNALYCSMTYRLIVEKDSKAYYCNFDYIVNHQIKYLHECVNRKYTDIIKKIETRLVILNAIQVVKNDESIMSNLHKMTSSELISKIVKLGFEEWVAKEVLKRPISYLTRSHDNEIKDLEDDLILNKEYLADPNKYLLEMYEKLKVMVSEFYDSKGHSVFVEDIAKGDINKYELSSSQLIFGDHLENDWDKGIIAVSKLGEVYYGLVPKVNYSPIDLPELEDENDSYVCTTHDSGKYLIIISNPRYIDVIPIERLSVGLGRYSKNWGFDHSVVDCLVVDDEFDLIDERGNEFNIVCENWVKSRVSNPSRVSRYKLSKYRNGDKVEKINFKI